MLTQSAWSNGGRTRDRALRNSCWRVSDVACISSSKRLHSFKSHRDSNKASSSTTRGTSYCFLGKKWQSKYSSGFNQNTANKGKHLFFISLQSQSWERSAVGSWMNMDGYGDLTLSLRDVTLPYEKQWSKGSACWLLQSRLCIKTVVVVLKFNSVQVHTENALPVYDGTHIQTDVLKATQHALLHRLQVDQQLIDMYELHAALKGALWWRKVCPREVSCTRWQGN